MESELMWSVLSHLLAFAGGVVLMAYLARAQAWKEYERRQEERFAAQRKVKMLRGVTRLPVGAERPAYPPNIVQVLDPRCQQPRVGDES